ncbi:MAG: helix-turn-helix domain-containing protein [Deltaproteobacteria bacterium]|nr:helix-turn-helix domain-containing protein [Deltaproteobacteria bacterium]
MLAKFENLNCFEILEVPYDASAGEIRQAYREALALYGEDSLSTYAFFTDDERNRLLEIIEEAFQTLIDEGRRARYGMDLVRAGEIEPSALERNERKAPVPIFGKDGGAQSSTEVDRIEKKLRDRICEKDFREILSKEIISGGDLRGIRETFGIELHEIFESTRISVTMLNAIEGDRFGELPPKIYLRNFLKSYAELLKLDPKRVMDGYMQNMALGEKVG